MSFNDINPELAKEIKTGLDEEKLEKVKKSFRANFVSKLAPGFANSMVEGQLKFSEEHVVDKAVKMAELIYEKTMEPTLSDEEIAHMLRSAR